MSATRSYASGSPFSTRVIARASARRSPVRTPAARVSRVQSRRPATAATLVGVRRARPVRAPRLRRLAGEHVRATERGDRTERDGAAGPHPARFRPRACNAPASTIPTPIERVGRAHHERQRAAADSSRRRAGRAGRCRRSQCRRRCRRRRSTRPPPRCSAPARAAPKPIAISPSAPLYARAMPTRSTIELLQPAADHETGADAAVEQAVAEVAGVQRVLREEDLADG